MTREILNTLKLMPFEELIEKTKNCETIASFLRKLDVAVAPHNYLALKQRLASEGLTLEDCFGPASTRRSTATTQRSTPSNIYFVENSKTPRSLIKKRIIRDSLLAYKCHECGMGPEWQTKVLVLVLDHINGINNDNRLENLRFLCPNCNSQTATFSGRNITRQGVATTTEKNSRPKVRISCACGSLMLESSSTCAKCAKNNIQYKIEWPQIDELKQMLAESNYTQVAKKLGVSDNAIRKHIRNST